MGRTGHRTPEQGPKAAEARIRAAGLRPTRQRRALAALLFEQDTGPDRHVTAEALHAEATSAGAAVSLATVYNTLHQFTAAGLLREVVVDAGPSYFDTNTSDHHHLYDEDTGEIADLSASRIRVSGIPRPRPGAEVARVDVVVRVRSRRS
ncbi:MAG: Fur family transcriptional regulator [Proteobacteria bacterium]|nr:Fur family transcriptional regulator [Pseudomonadota bacterium]MDA1131854.1 Fur family transcriptional regulator [Pseudomonadota bacterium]